MGKPCGAPDYVGDGVCDDNNNHKDCKYDGGDCCPKSVTGGVVKKTYCKECKCIDPKNQGPPAKSTCGSPSYKGDGNCDDDNNNKGCEYDGGDCCAKTVKGGKVSKNYCKECKCKDPKNQGPPAKSTCGSPDYKGDGNCDDDNNNKGCDYDGGDCCAKSNGGPVKKAYCKECACKDPNNQGASTCGAPSYVGDGNCDDNNNNKGCGYDGGDCCAKSNGGSVSKAYCKECKCKDPKHAK